MTTIKIKDVDCDRCLICGRWIGKGNDPALCSEHCKTLYEYEVGFNKWAKEQSKYQQEVNK